MSSVPAFGSVDLAATERPQIKPVAFVALVMIAVAGVSMFILKPAIVAALMHDLGLSAGAAGTIMAMEMVGSGLGAILAAVLLRYMGPRTLILAGWLVLTFFTVVSSAVTVDWLLGAARLGAGIGGAFLVGTVVTVIAASANPERLFGLYFMAQLIFGALAFPFLPQLSESFGIRGIYLALACYALLVPILVWGIPRAVHTTVSSRASGLESGVSFVVLRLLAIWFVYFTGVGALWAFLGPVFEHNVAGVFVDDPALARFLAQALSLALICGIAASGLASLLGVRYGRTVMVVLGVTATTLAVVASGLVSMPWIAAVGVLLFKAAWHFSAVYLAGAVAAADASGRSMPLAVAMQTGGFALGPFMAGFGADAFGLGIIPVLSIMLMCPVLALIIWTVPEVDRLRASAQEGTS